MPNTLYIKVDQLSTVLESYNRIKVYRSTSAGGTFSEITTVSTRIVLNDDDDLYIFTDSAGDTTHWYRTSYFSSSSSEESTLSAAVAGVPTRPTQLLENMQVVITLDSTIAATDGSSLGEEFQYYFTTTYNPYYCSSRQVLLQIGAFIRNIHEDTVNLAILEASLAADKLTWKTPSTDNRWYQWARQQWVCCKASEILLLNVTGGGSGLKSKTLADLSVDYDTGSRSTILEKVLACQARWEAVLNAGGFAVKTPQYVVKGEGDTEAPIVGRIWEPTTDGYPAANVKNISSSGRRSAHSYLRRNSGKSTDTATGFNYFRNHRLRFTVTRT